MLFVSRNYPAPGRNPKASNKKKKNKANDASLHFFRSFFLPAGKLTPSKDLVEVSVVP